MFWLFSQTLFWLILAFLFGLWMGWLLRGLICGPCNRDSDDSSGYAAAGGQTASYSSDAGGDSSASSSYAAAGGGSAAAATEVAAADDGPVISDDMRPAGLDGPQGEADDLKRIRGVGPVIEKTLNGLGIYHFQQIADFSRDNIAWVDNYIDFPGRIDREGWVSQAADLARGRATEFAQRYDKGEVGDQNPNRKD